MKADVHVVSSAAFRRALTRALVRHLIAERQRRGWTQLTLAEFSGYSRQTVKFWEQGRRLPRPEALRDWMETLAA